MTLHQTKCFRDAIVQFKSPSNIVSCANEIVRLAANSFFLMSRVSKVLMDFDMLSKATDRSAGIVFPSVFQPVALSSHNFCAM